MCVFGGGALTCVRSADWLSFLAFSRSLYPQTLAINHALQKSTHVSGEGRLVVRQLLLSRSRACAAFDFYPTHSPLEALWHVRNAKCLGWNALNEDDGIRFLIDILPIAGATTVKIEGLGARTELNGMQATILGLCSDCRCEVCTDSGEQVRVKPCNLEVVD